VTLGRMSPVSRTALLALVVAAPALGAAVFFASDDWGKTRPAVAILPPTEADLTAAVWEGDVMRAFVIARSGASAHVPVPFRNDTMTEGIDLPITPFLLAAARGDENMVLMFLNHTEAPAPRSRTMAACLVLERGDRQLAAVLAPELPADTCPEAASVPDLLRRYALELQEAPDPLLDEPDLVGL